jgi:hypothetical protein
MASGKVRTGIWFAAGVAAVAGLWLGGNELYTRLVVLPQKFPPLAPGKVSLIGMKVPGYHIVVSNGIARLQAGEASTFGGPSRTSIDEGSAIPIAALVGTLRQEKEAASDLISALNEIKYPIEPLTDRIWNQVRIDEALQGKGETREQLEYDLATSIDGKAISKVNWDRLTTGIWLEVPVRISVPASGGANVVETRVLVPYKTRLAAAAENNLNRIIERGGLGNNLRPTAATINGVYNMALDSSEEMGFENVAQSLRQRFSKKQSHEMAAPVDKLLKDVEVLVSEKTITASDLERHRREDGDGDVYSLTLSITDDSRLRLWQYTYLRPGSQLLLVSNGVAIAAPVVQHEIKYSTVEITGITERRLAEDSLRFIRSVTKKNS